MGRRTEASASIEGLQIQYLIQPQPIKNGTNLLGLVPGERDVVMAVLTAAYKDSADDDAVMKQIKPIVDKQESVLQQEGSLLRFEYLNCAYKSEDSIGCYGQENKKRLQDVGKSTTRMACFRSVFQEDSSYFEQMRRGKSVMAELAENW